MSVVDLQADLMNLGHKVKPFHLHPEGSQLLLFSLRSSEIDEVIIFHQDEKKIFQCLIKPDQSLSLTYTVNPGTIILPSSYPNLFLPSPFPSLPSFLSQKKILLLSSLANYITSDKLEVKVFKGLTKSRKIKYEVQSFPFVSSLADLDFGAVLLILHRILYYPLKMINNKIFLQLDKNNYLSVDGIFPLPSSPPSSVMERGERGKILPDNLTIELAAAQYVMSCLNIPFDSCYKEVVLLEEKQMQRLDFNFSEEITKTFTEGECGYLCWNLYHKLNWGIYSLGFISKDTPKDQILTEARYDSKTFLSVHLVNLVPTRNIPPDFLYEGDDQDKLDMNLFVDINGIVTFSDLITKWSRRSYDQYLVLIPLKYSKDFMPGEYMKCLMKKKKDNIDRINNIGTQCIQRMELNKHYQVRKVVIMEAHPFFGLVHNIENGFQLFREHPFFERRSFHKWIMNNYRLLHQLGIGPDVRFEERDDKLFIYMEYFPIQGTTYLYEKHADKIRELVDYLHSKGYVHGDVNAGNIIFNDKEEPKFIDADVMFPIGEADSFPFKLWITRNVPNAKTCIVKDVGIKTIEELILSERRSLANEVDDF
jgi:hypothetical protein